MGADSVRADDAPAPRSGKTEVEQRRARGARRGGRSTVPPRSSARCTDEDGLDRFHDAAAAWTEGDAADLECRTCGGVAPVADWSAEGAALACLVFNFWGWDELRPEVIRVVAEATGGHRMASGSGKI